jgi:hypothetical protein
MPVNGGYKLVIWGPYRWSPYRSTRSIPLPLIYVDPVGPGFCLFGLGQVHCENAILV